MGTSPRYLRLAAATNMQEVQVNASTVNTPGNMATGSFCTHTNATNRHTNQNGVIVCQQCVNSVSTVNIQCAINLNIEIYIVRI